MRRLLLAPAMVVVLMAAGCGVGESDGITSLAGTASQPSTQEVHFDSDGFKLAGDLHLPVGDGPHTAA